MGDNRQTHDIFISYSRKNKDVVLPIKDEIERTLELKCWIDLSDIPCGAESFKKKVISGIKQTRIAFLFFLSAESQSSEYAMKEINFAKKTAKKQVILIRLNDDKMTDEFAFDYQDADIIDWRVPEQKEKLLRDLRAWADQINQSRESSHQDATPNDSGTLVKGDYEDSLTTCPVCGKKNNPVDTFRCQECGRENLCTRHQDENTYLCCDCMKMLHAEDDSVQIAPRQHMTTTVTPKSFADVGTLVTYGQMTGESAEHHLNGELLLGRYEVLATLGQGGTGYVYKCFDRLGMVEVAVKVLPLGWSRDSSAEENIRENFRLISGLRHPGIVGLRTLEHDSSTGSFLLVMDLAPGMNLRNWASTHRAKRHFQAKLKIIAEIAAILDYAHSQGILHRDVKPDNIAIDNDGGVHVFDFGIASQNPSADCQIGQIPRSLSGTPSYMSPEQWRGQQQDATADQYSLGVLSYELISGSLPFVASDLTSLMSRVMSEPIVLIQGVPDHVNVALLRALAKDPRERFSSCKEFADALEGNIVRKKVPFLNSIAVCGAPLSVGAL